MIRVIFVLLAFTLVNYACQTDTSNYADDASRDSSLKRYISLVDKLPYYDTSIFEFKLLKAYSSNDTNTLKNIVERIKNSNTKVDWQINLDSCAKQPALKEIYAEEKYRFIYSSAFCPYITLTTIVRYRNSAILNTIVYQYAWKSVPCKIIEQSTTPIDSLSWYHFQESLEVADFWGLKSDNGKYGVDGSTLEVYGYKKGINSDWDPNKSSYISRWNPVNNSIFESFILLLKYSKTKKGCIGAK